MKNHNTSPVVSAGVCALLVSAFLATLSLAVLAESNVKKEARKAGQAVGEVVHDVGQGAKKIGKTVGNAAKEGVEAAKEGGREFKRAVKGER